MNITLCLDRADEWLGPPGEDREASVERIENHLQNKIISS